MKKSTIRIVGILLTLIVLLPLVSCGGRIRDFSQASSNLENKGYEVLAVPLFLVGNLADSALADASLPINTDNIEWIIEGKKAETIGADSTPFVFIVGFTNETTAIEGIEDLKEEYKAQADSNADEIVIEEVDNTIYCKINGELYVMLKRKGNIVYFGDEQGVLDATN